MSRVWQPKPPPAVKRSHRRHGPEIPLRPLQDWVEHQLALRAGVGVAWRAGEPTSCNWLAGRMGITDRTLHRIRHGVGTGKRIVGGHAEHYTYGITTWARFRVEDMLHRAGADFYDVYPEFAHERDVELEPDAWCEGCREVVTPVSGLCLWCDSVVSKPQFEDAA